MKPPSTARTAGRSDWAERRFRRQPFILLSFSSSKKARKAQETQSYQRIQCIGHMGFKGLSNAVTSTLPYFHQWVSHGKMVLAQSSPNAPLRFHSRKRVHTRLSKKDRAQRLTRRNRGVSDGGAITTLGVFRTFANIPGPGIKTAYFAALGPWPGALPKNAESLRSSDALMRVAVPRRRGPAGLRDLFSLLSKL